MGESLKENIYIMPTAAFLVYACLHLQTEWV